MSVAAHGNNRGMKRILVSALRLIVGPGVMLFSAFAVAATVLIFFAWQGSLAWDDCRPLLAFGMIAIACFRLAGSGCCCGTGYTAGNGDGPNNGWRNAAD